MPKVTWLGEDEGNVAGPSFNLWNGIKFPKGVAVEVTDEHMLRKAMGNRFYKVTGYAPEQKAPELNVAPVKPEEPPREEKVKAVAAAPKKEEPKAKAKVYDFREAEKGSGYAPAPTKKKVRKPKPPDKHAHR